MSVRKIYGPIREGKHQRIRTNMLLGRDTVKFTESFWDLMVTVKECKTKECQNNLQQLQWKE